MENEDLVSLWQKLCDEHNDKELPVLAPDDIPQRADWSCVEPVRSLSSKERRQNVLAGLKGLFDIEHAPVSKRVCSVVPKDLVLSLLRDNFNI